MSANALKIIKANYDARATALDELRSIDESAEGRAYNEDETAKITEIRSRLEGIDARIHENLKAEIRSAEITDAMGSLVGLMARDGETVDMRSIGQRFAQDDEVRSWASRGARGTSPSIEIDMEYRAVTDTTSGSPTSTGTSAGAFTNNQRLTRIGNDFLTRRVFLLDLLPVIPISTGSVEYVQDKSPLADMADKAVEVAESGAKPQAGITPQIVTETAAVIAAWVNVTRQAAADAPQIMGYLDGKLRYSIKRRADYQAINGNGTSPNLKGLLNRSGILTYAPGAAEARAISIRKAVTIMEAAEAVPEIIVLNPSDAETFDLTNATSAGLHAITDFNGGFTQGPTKTAWGMTQVHSNAIPAGTALLLDPTAVAVFDRQQVSAYMTDSHASLFIQNTLTLLLEARIGLGLFDPSSACKVTFNGTT